MIVRHVHVQKEVLATWYQLCRKVQKTQYVQSVPKEGEVKRTYEIELNMSNKHLIIYLVFDYLNNCYKKVLDARNVRMGTLEIRLANEEMEFVPAKNATVITM